MLRVVAKSAGNVELKRLSRLQPPPLLPKGYSYHITHLSIFMFFALELLLSICQLNSRLFLCPQESNVSVKPLTCEQVESSPVTGSGASCPQENEIISRILDDLQADFDRQAGRLSWDDVHQIVLARSLTPDLAVEVWLRATECFPLIHETTDEALQPESIDKRFLSAISEQVLTRRVAAGRIAAEADRLGILPARLKQIVCGMSKAAFDRLVLSNTGLVRTEAARFKERTNRLDLEDLFQEGILGLIRAIEKFDPDKGYRLSTYASCWIRQHIRRAIFEKARTIRLPAYLEEMLRQLKKKRYQLRQKLDRAPTAVELARELGSQEGDVNLLLKVEGDAELLGEFPKDTATNSNGQRTGCRVKDFVDEVECAELSELIREQLRCLDSRARFIIRQRFELEGRTKYTLERLGEKFQITRERVRQIEAKGLERLAQGQRGRALADYIEGGNDGGTDS
jgi:RNA polymerase primary sigma factor